MADAIGVRQEVSDRPAAYRSAAVHWVAVDDVAAYAWMDREWDPMFRDFGLH